MATPDRDSTEGLEIISAGSLYIGPLDKKYWSSSRGKDRHPYPIGYHAVRTHAGSTYRMNIHEGRKGPLFVISSLDGASSSGQTPDMAWENFQRESGPRVKTLHEKRFSCKIDGIELFGFRNPLVQRLLRELVANLNGRAEQSLFSPNYCDESSREKQVTQIPDSCKCPALDSSLEEQLNTGGSGMQMSNSGKSFVNDDLQKGSPRAVSCFLEKASILPKQQKIVRSSDVISHDDDSLTATKGGGEVLMSAKVKHENDVEDCIADTLDYAQDKIVDDSEEPIHGLNPGEDIGWSGFSNENSGKSDSDSVGQDLPMSMLKVLLPSAVPLVKYTYKRKRPRRHIVKTSKRNPLYLVQEEAYKKNKCTYHHTYDKSQGGLESNEPDDLVNDSTVNALISESKHHGDAELVIPDSLDISAHDFTQNRPLPFGFNKTTHSLPDKRPSSPNILCLPVKLDHSRGPSNNQHVNEENVDCYHGNAVVSGEGHLVQDPVPPGSVKTDILLLSFGSGEQLPNFPDLGLQDTNIQTEHAKSNHREPTSPTAKGAADDKTEDYIDCQQEEPHSHSPAERHCNSHCKSSHADDCSLMRTFQSKEIECDHSSCNDIHGQMMQAGGVKISMEHQCLDTLRSSPDSKGLLSKMDQSTLSYPATKGSAVDDQENIEVVDPKKELECLVELVGCYTHPGPILSLLLNKEGNDICICVVCGLPRGSERVLFIYKIPIRGKAPSFLGYTSIVLPTIRGITDKIISVERSILQFTSDAQQLILLDSVKAPLCSEQNIHCLCSACTSDSCEENALKVVHVKFGYISLIKKFRTLNSICCVLLCEPNYLLVAEEDGRLHVWVMNLTWSASEEEFDLPTLYCAPSIWDLKRLPRCSYLIIGHNSSGTFGLWDISKRVLLTSFSSPGNLISQVIPVGIFCSQKVQSLADLKKEEQIKEIMAETKMSFWRPDKDHSFVPSYGDDIIIWLLISTASAEDQKMLPVGPWRLGLLVKNMVLVGDILDSRASAANASAGQGIIGTFDGLVYMWDFWTGAKVTNLHFDKGGSISRIVTDAESGAFAVAEECNLRIFVKSSTTNAAED